MTATATDCTEIRQAIHRDRERWRKRAIALLAWDESELVDELAAEMFHYYWLALPEELETDLEHFDFETAAKEIACG